MKRNPKVDEYIARQADFAQPILEHMRKLAHKALPDGEEALKWGVPYFTMNGKNAVGMAAFKNHASVMVSSTQTEGGGMGNFGKLTSVAELPSDDELITQFRDSALAVQKPETARPKPKPALETSDDLAKAIDEIEGARFVFDGFTDAQRRSYIEWITSAKREATCERRIVEATQWISEGKRRNWKYEKC
ncbi:MAG: YdeI/OmpD-associated family protein [Erythrobacter sp.]|nr:YdeI/OmpD-associated family protein [Erythrobacter sp.]